MDVFDDETNEAGFGLETKHLLERGSRSEDDEPPDTIPLNEAGRLRFRPDIVLEGPAYAGVKRSREAILEDAGEELQKDEMLFRSDENFFFSEERLEDANETLQNEIESLHQEYTVLQKQEEDILKNLKAHEETELKKGVAISLQKDLWDKALEIRIMLQKHFLNANMLPMKNIRLAFCNDDEEMFGAFDSLILSIIQALDSLTDLLKALIDQNSAIPGAMEDDEPTISMNPRWKMENTPGMGINGVLNQADAAWQGVNSLYSRIAPYCNNSMDKWHRKTQLSTGAAVMKSKLRAFNQSISQQIANLMRDPSRLIAKMQHKSSSLRVLGLHAETSQANGLVCESLPEECRMDQAVDDINAEFFDDSEFYQQLLHEFLESSDLAALGGASLSTVAKPRNKKRKTVDRRASKGRKIRYNVHERIVNFMVPEPINVPQMADKLFMNLFGQKIR